MPRRIRELMREYRRAGCSIHAGKGKGSHNKIKHQRYEGCVILSGKAGDDAKSYQEADLRKFLREINH